MYLSGCKARHADSLINRWLSAELVDFRKLAARALGQMRLKRAIRPLFQRLNDPSEDIDVLHEAALALGNIGTPEVADALAGLVEERTGPPERHGEYLESGLSMCLTEIKDPERFRALCERLLNGKLREKCWVHRAIGIQKDAALEPLLSAGSTQ